jgi:predicted DNA-binding transcriptional regulator AlpA
VVVVIVAERLIKARDVAVLLGVEVGTVWDYWERGDLPGFRLGGCKGGPLRFRETEIVEWLETTCRGGTVPFDNRNGPAALSRPGPGTGGRSSHAPRILRPVGHD